MAYFLLSVANRVNLELCIEHALAGFTNSINGLWTFVDIEEGDFVSFLYGTRVFNLYRVEEKEALKGVDIIGPWPSVTFQMSGKTYYFLVFWCHLPHNFSPGIHGELHFLTSSLKITWRQDNVRQDFRRGNLHILL